MGTIWIDMDSEFESEQLTLSSQWMKLAQKVLGRQEHPVAAKAFSPTTATGCPRVPRQVPHMGCCLILLCPKQPNIQKKWMCPLPGETECLSRREDWNIYMLNGGPHDGSIYVFTAGV